MRRAEEGKSERRFQAHDLYPVVIGQNFQDDPARAADARERLMGYAKKGHLEMWKFMFSNWEKVPMLINRCWEVEKCEEYVAFHNKSRT